MNYLTAWRKGDLVRMPSGKEFRLTSDGYEKDGKVYCNTDRKNGKPISYLKLIEKAYLVETISGK
jgi:hypothetical protein